MDLNSLPSPTLPRMVPRAPDTHKGDFGRALLIGGSRGMSGAIALAGIATLRSGAGLTTLAVPEGCWNIVASFEPSYMTLPLAEDAEGIIDGSALAKLLKATAKANCVACGPGMGRSVELTMLVRELYTQVAAPMVLDADALNALASLPRGVSEPGGPRILTPHPGEFRRLIGDEQAPAETLPQRAVELAAEQNVVVLLKGHRTLITDGRQAARNTTGNPGMATGGCGDVLTGIITALVCQGLEPFAAAQLGAHLHGMAGDLAAKELGQICLIASDLIRFLPQAFFELGAPHCPFSSQR